MWQTIFKDPVTIDALNLNMGTDAVTKTFFGCDRLDGWDDFAEPIVQMTQFGYSDGAVDSDRFPFKEKYLEIGGWVSAPDRLSALKAKMKLGLIFDPNKRITVTRNGPLPLKMLVRISTKLEFPQVDDHGEAFRWHVQVVAPWPFRLSPTTLTGTAGVYIGGSFFRTYPRTYPIVYYPGAGASLVGVVAHTNWCANPSFENNTLSWSVYSANVTVTSFFAGGYAVNGVKTGVFTATAALTANFLFGSTAISSIPAAANDLWSFRLKARLRGGSTAGRTVIFALGAFNAAQTFLGYVTDQIVTTGMTTSAWTDVIKNNTVVAPAGTAFISLLMYTGEVWVTNDGIEIDSISIEKLGSTRTYFDGDTPTLNNDFYTWVGLIGNSTSQQTTYAQVVRSVVVPDNVVAVNNGNADGYPLITIVGPLVTGSWYLINETTGERFTLGVDISSGTSLVVDTKEKTAYIGSSSVDYWFRGDWPRVSPNSVSNLFHLVATQPNADARLTVSVNDTYR